MDKNELSWKRCRPRRPRVERRRKNLFRHLGLEGLGVGEEHLLRLTLSEGEEGEVAMEEHLLVMGAITIWWDLIITLLLGRHPVRR